MFKQVLADHLANTRLAHLLQNIYSSLELSVMGFYNDRSLVQLIKTLSREDRPILFKPSELALIYYFAQSQQTCSGDYAEVGVYRGSSAKTICAAKGTKRLHLFDTFDGLPTSRDIDRRFSPHMFSSSASDVKIRLASYPNIHIYQGIFPASAAPVTDKTFAFVHLDVDVFQSTIAALQFFYPRLAPQGILLTHDYSSAAGVKKAFDNFFHLKPEPLRRLPMSQCFIIKQPS
ncbi:MAG: hypothetical protein A3E37_01450 [Candidatus Andersenbacteria bacterium RIFCSPHIGHO2_12_FULL_46_9]|nr:MAG: hypothetical protein A3B76_04545 [Candidatus Andersenbacteria bacterium RIFCSPHIGHO2_02_FULL_46_16]OGY38261.1 MAG: hypothetical protein A3E37_01450 [Candidatus Andersenbacteria bacterium RIFCSPHIGHO2_12_FULL_46_9]HBE90431.1 macrocin-O-methyltransferase [Candidatus Andersenbacteria bacterium]